MRLLSVITVFFLCCGPVQAQPADTVYGYGYLLPAPPDTLTTQPDAATWERLSSSDAYSRYKDEVEFQELRQEENAGRGFSLISGILSFFRSTAGRLLLVASMALLVGMLLYRWLQRRGGGLFYREQKFKNENNFPETPVELHQDWEAAMRQAVQAANYRLAIRYGYLNLLHFLDNNTWIDYHPNKTNRDYANHLPPSEVREWFLKLSHIYERTWYGHQPAQSKDYDAFAHCLNTLKSAAGV